MNNKNNIIAIAMFLIGLLIFGIVFATSTNAQEVATVQRDVQGPPHPSIDLWTGCCEDHGLRFDSGDRNERERGSRTDEDVLVEDVRERALRELPSMCIITPIPIEDYYIGCLIRFEPEPATVDVWE